MEFINSAFLLKHLQSLTDAFKYQNSKIYFIHLYSKKHQGKYIPIPAESEGIACVDDSARAVVFALEIYESFGHVEALEQAKKWLTFLEYMQDEDGLITNFIYDAKGQRNFNVSTSITGGAWWSARAKWAWAKAYKATKEKKYLDLYFKTKITEDYQNDVASILLLAGLEIFEKEEKAYLNSLLERITSCRSQKGYFLHAKDAPLHMWGYHELEAVAKAANFLGNKKELLNLCETTVDTLASDIINNGFYFEYETRDKKEINPYCVSPFVRGIYELYKSDKKEKYKKLLQKCFNWFTKMYDTTTGACFDWIQGDKISTDCGAESSIEAGFSYIRKLKMEMSTKRLR